MPSLYVWTVDFALKQQKPEGPNYEYGEVMKDQIVITGPDMKNLIRALEIYYQAGKVRKSDKGDWTYEVEVRRAIREKYVLTVLPNE